MEPRSCVLVAPERSLPYSLPRQDIQRLTATYAGRHLERMNRRPDPTGSRGDDASRQISQGPENFVHAQVTDGGACWKAAPAGRVKHDDRSFPFHSSPSP